MIGNVTNTTLVSNDPRNQANEPIRESMFQAGDIDPLPQLVKSFALGVLSNDALRNTVTQLAICGLNYVVLKASPVVLSAACSLMSPVRFAVANPIETTVDGEQSPAFCPNQQFEITENKLVPTKPIEFNQPIEPWTNTDDVESGEIEGTIRVSSQTIHLKQSVMRTLLGQATLKQLNLAIAKSGVDIQPFKELPYDVYVDKKTEKVFIGSPDCGYQPFGRLSSHEELILHRLLTFAIPGTHDGDMGKTSSGEPIILDIEGTDLSIESIAKFIRKFGLIMNTPNTDHRYFTKDTFSTAATILKELKLQLNENSYKGQVEQMLNGLDPTRIDRASIIDALENDNRNERNTIDSEASVNLLFDALEEKSLSDNYLEAQQERLDVIIQMFDSIAGMDKWNALQRGIVRLYPSILDKQASYLEKTEISISANGEFNPKVLTEGKNSFSTIVAPNSFSYTLMDTLNRALPNGQLLPLRALMIVLKKCDERSLIQH